ncbi:hypothetical protein [Streptomyces sp. SDr-06]|uniref:hypothetical protein n=1 Tax=Streptomyces sp. SDr-06 TaxID=2267702 RepID=UPI0011C07E19|nr:hypothetical protein [Streptomyces sp. SDr-06]
MEGDDQESVAFDWRAVVHRDFDVDHDAPGDRSSATLKVLEDDLGVPDDAEGIEPVRRVGAAAVHRER